jgi:hypothetical protein
MRLSALLRSLRSESGVYISGEMKESSLTSDPHRGWVFFPSDRRAGGARWAARCQSFGPRTHSFTLWAGPPGPGLGRPGMRWCKKLAHQGAGFAAPWWAMCNIFGYYVTLAGASGERRLYTHPHHNSPTIDTPTMIHGVRSSIAIQTDRTSSDHVIDSGSSNFIYSSQPYWVPLHSPHSLPPTVLEVRRLQMSPHQDDIDHGAQREHDHEDKKEPVLRLFPLTPLDSVFP